MVWDNGTCKFKDAFPPDAQLARGKIDVMLYGKKLRGGFILIPTATRAADLSHRKRWLLIKHRDEYANTGWDVERRELARSVLTGRTLKEIEESGQKKRRLARREKRPGI